VCWASLRDRGQRCEREQRTKFFCNVATKRVTDAYETWQHGACVVRAVLPTMFDEACGGEGFAKCHVERERARKRRRKTRCFGREARVQGGVGR
jgi:hypothetical protein